MNIMQGDAYSIPITITAADGTVIDDTMTETVEVMKGSSFQMTRMRTRQPETARTGCTTSSWAHYKEVTVWQSKNIHSPKTAP